MTRWCRLVAAVATGLLVAGPAIAAPPERAVRRPGGQFQPARGGRYLAWERNSRAHPRHYDVVVRRLGSHRVFRVNPRGTEAANGSIDGRLLAWQQFKGKHSDVKLLDLPTRTHRRLPRAVNSRHWEYWPSLSGRWLLFGRRRGGGARKIILFDRKTGSSRTLAHTSSKSSFASPGQVNGNWVVWSKCTPSSTCNVFRYNIARRTRVKLTNRGHFQRTPSVTAEGTVYLVRSGAGCGHSAKLVRYPLAGRPRVLVRLPPGRDIEDTYVYGDGGGTRVFFDRGRCGHPVRSDIYRLAEPRLFPLFVKSPAAGTGTVTSKPAGIACGSDCSDAFRSGASVVLSAAADTSSNFTGWGGACSGQAPTCTVPMVESRSVMAFFDPASSFSLSVVPRGTGRGTVTSHPRGVLCGNDCAQSYRAGTSVKLTAAAAPGSTFAGWSGSCAGTRAGACTVTMDRIRTAGVTFSRAGSPVAVRRTRYPRLLDGHGSGHR